MRLGQDLGKSGQKMRSLGKTDWLYCQLKGIIREIASFKHNTTVREEEDCYTTDKHELARIASMGTQQLRLNNRQRKRDYVRCQACKRGWTK
jgi:hypothetical protein